MSGKTFDLGDYVDVKDRIAIFYELYANGRLVTTDVRLTSEPDGKPRVMVEAAAYRTPDDPLPGRGWSWMELPGTTSYTKGSELENTETSAWGRAIAALGILGDKSIASAQEVANKAAHDAPERPETPAAAPSGAERHDGLVGTVARGRPPVDMELRQTPDGVAWGFKVTEGRRGYQALATGALAEALAASGLAEGQRVHVWGAVVMVPWQKDGKDMPPYARIELERVATDEWTLPSQEAPSEPMFRLDPDEAALVGGGLP